HYRFDTTAGLGLGRTVGTYIFQNFLLPRGGAAAQPGAGSTHLPLSAITAEEVAGMTLGKEADHTLVTSGQPSSTATDLGRSSLISGSASIGLPVAQQTVYSSTGVATSTLGIGDARALLASRVYSSRVGDLINLAESGEDCCASAPDLTANA